MIFDRVFLATARAEPEVFYGVPMRGLLLVRRNLVEAKKAPMPIIKIRSAIGMSTFQVHQVLFSGLVQSAYGAESLKYAPLSFRSNSIIGLNASKQASCGARRFKAESEITEKRLNTEGTESSKDAEKTE